MYIVTFQVGMNQKLHDIVNIKLKQIRNEEYTQFIFNKWSWIIVWTKFKYVTIKALIVLYLNFCTFYVI